MDIVKLYRKRIIPSECILLKDDEIIYHDANVLITKWKTLNPKTEFSHGASAYIFEKGIKARGSLRSRTFWQMSSSIPPGG